MRLNIWAPSSEEPSGVGDYAVEQAIALAAHVSVSRVSENEAADPPEADLDLYHIDNSPACGFVYRAAVTRSGVVLLHDWCLNELVRSQTQGRGDTPAYLREMRRDHGRNGSFVARQIALGFGGALWPALYPLNDRILESSLGIVALTPAVAALARLRVRDLPVLALPRHLSLPPGPLPTPAEARRAIGLPDTVFVVIAAELDTSAVQLELAAKVVGRLRARHPRIRLVAAGAGEPADLVRHLVAADVVLALRFKAHGGIPGVVVQALGLGRPVLVTAGTPEADAFPEGVVIPVDPGQSGAACLEALLSRLVEDEELRERLGRVARAHVLAHHNRENTSRALAGFLRDVFRDHERLSRAAATRRPAAGALAESLLDELRAAAHDLGLDPLPLGLAPLLAPLDSANP